MLPTGAARRPDPREQVRGELRSWSSCRWCRSRGPTRRARHLVAQAPGELRCRPTPGYPRRGRPERGGRGRAGSPATRPPAPDRTRRAPRARQPSPGSCEEPARRSRRAAPGARASRLEETTQHVAAELDQACRRPRTRSRRGRAPTTRRPLPVGVPAGQRRRDGACVSGRSIRGRRARPRRPRTARR